MTFEVFFFKFIVLVFALSSHDIKAFIFYGRQTRHLKGRCNFLRVYFFHANYKLVKSMCMANYLF